MKCVICNEREATQKHHVSYIPERVIDVCVECHKIIHKHGVGAATGQIYIATDSPESVILPLRDTELYLVYKCQNCHEQTIITYPLLNFLMNKKLREPRKCPDCELTDFEIDLEQSGVRSHTIITSSEKAEELV